MATEKAEYCLDTSVL